MTNDERHPTGLLHSADELRQLIRENPALPLLVFAGEEANSGDYPYMSCSYIKAYKGEFLDCTQTVNDCMCYTDRDEFEEAVADSLADGDYTDEEFDALVKKTVAEYDPYWNGSRVSLHDAKKVDELANVLHMVILDNPAVFAPVKEGQHENG